MDMIGSVAQFAKDWWFGLSIGESSRFLDGFAVAKGGEVDDFIRKGGKGKLLCGLVVFALVLGIVGCGTSKPPSEVVTQFYLLVSKGNYDSASKYLSSDAKIMFGLFVGLAEGMKQFASEEFGSQVIRRVEILSERINGNQAEVGYILHYTDGTKGSADSDVLVKEKGQWKIGLGW